jgi:hypothetical protein
LKQEVEETKDISLPFCALPAGFYLLQYSDMLFHPSVEDVAMFPPPVVTVNVITILWIQFYVHY